MRFEVNEAAVRAGQSVWMRGIETLAIVESGLRFRGRPVRHVIAYDGRGVRGSVVFPAGTSEFAIQEVVERALAECGA